MGKTNTSMEILNAGQDLFKEKEYWLDKLSGGFVISAFPYDYQADGTDNRHTGNIDYTFDGKVFSRLMQLRNESDPRLHMIVVAITDILIHLYTGANDIIVGTTIDKQDPEAEYVNTILPLRNQIWGHMTFKQFLLQVRDTVAQAVENQNYPVEELLNQLTVNEGENRFSLFEAAVLLENLQDRKYLQHIQPAILFSFNRTPTSICMDVEYKTSLYKKSTIEKILEHFKRLLEIVIFDIELELFSIDLLSPRERQELIVEFNNTVSDYPGKKAIYELFEEQVAKTPAATALILGDRHVSYGELDEKSNRLARYLRQKGIEAESILGIMMERSIEMIFGILGILKSGGAYLPIDTDYPRDRIGYMLADSGANILLATPATQIKVGENFIKPLRLTLQLIDIKMEFTSMFAHPPSTLTSTSICRVSPANLAYVIYTSGSTGKPNGVAVEHRALVNYIWWAAKMYVKNEKVNFPLYTSIGFDLTNTSLFTPLITGNTIYIYRGDGKDYLLGKIFDENKIEAIKLTPVHLMIVGDNIREKKLSKIKRFIVGGEKLETQWARKIYESFEGNIEIYNEYGPTEATVGCMIYKYNAQKDKGTSVPIGVPVDNVRIYLVDRHMKNVPPGVVGELYIAGDGLARGYLNNPGLTSERFISNTFEPGGKLYKTGDTARRLIGGDFEFLGRIDQQVKIRGYRVEIREVENCLRAFEEINEAVVLLKQKIVGEGHLCAYIVHEPLKHLDISMVREYLSERLPSYMVPSYFVQMEEIPLTVNGKVDRKALPDPDFKTIGETLTGPRNQVERELTKIWAEILAINDTEIGIDTIFFHLGGHSIKVIRLVDQVYKTFKIKMQLREVFENPTIRKIAAYLEGAKESSYISIEPAEIKEYYSLSSPQKRLYVIQQMELDSIAYNLPQITVLEGDMKRRKWEDAFKKLINRHESLRVSFHMAEEEPTQLIHQDVAFKIEFYEVKVDYGTQKIINNFIRPFDLTQAPLLRVALIKQEEENHLLLVDMHHIISDGVSHSILIKDFLAIYEGKELTALKLQYKDYSQWQNSEEQLKRIKKQEQYWLKEFAGEIPVLDLQSDYSRPSQQSFAGDAIHFSIGEEETRLLKKLVSEEEVTLFILLLSIFNVLMFKLTGQRDIVVGTGVEGRRHGDLREIIGMFINTLALRNYPDGNKIFIEFLHEVKEKTLNAFENQDYQFEDLVEKVASLDRGANRNPIFNVMFQHQNFDVPEIKITGLTLKPYQFENRISKFDMTLFSWDSSPALSFMLEYSIELFTQETIDWFIEYYKEIVASIANNPGQTIAEIGIIAEEERIEKLSQLSDNLENE